MVSRSENDLEMVSSPKLGQIQSDRGRKDMGSAAKEQNPHFSCQQIPIHHQ